MQYRELEDAEVRACISMLAARLEVSEYELFCRAYEACSGRPPRADMERLFGAYITSSRVPHWVRHFARLNHPGAEPDSTGSMVFMTGLLAQWCRTRSLRRRDWRHSTTGDSVAA